MEYKDYYKTLGVDRKATPAEVKKAYRRLARELHPDRHPDDKTAERRFKEVNEANEVLTDPAKRQQYDLLGANWDQHARNTGGNPFAGGDPFGPGGPFAGYAAQAGQAGNVRYEFRGGGAEDFSDFFPTFFGGDAPGEAGAAGAGGGESRTPPGGHRTGRRSQHPRAVARHVEEASTTCCPSSVSMAGATGSRTRERRTDAAGATATSTSRSTLASRRGSTGRPGSSTHAPTAPRAR